jgi:hypothetical protein
MKLLFAKSNSGDRLNYKWLFIFIFLLTNHFYILQIDRKVSLAEDIKLANVDHDIDDIINTPKRKLTPSRNRSTSGRRRADLPKNRRQARPSNSHVERNREQNRRRK